MILFGTAVKKYSWPITKTESGTNTRKKVVKIELVLNQIKNKNELLRTKKYLSFGTKKAKTKKTIVMNLRIFSFFIKKILKC